MILASDWSIYQYAGLSLVALMSGGARENINSVSKEIASQRALTNKDEKNCEYN